MTQSDEQRETSYNPLPVPDRVLQHPSVRDDVRRTIRKHKFQPSHEGMYTSINDIYKLYLSDSHQTNSQATQERFRSALGRVLRPPASSGEYALSFAADVSRCKGFISMVSPDCASVDPSVLMREYKHESGRRNREIAKSCREVERLRERRREKARMIKERPLEDDEPQEVSFRCFRMERYGNKSTTWLSERAVLAEHLTEKIIHLVQYLQIRQELAESMSAYAAVRYYLHVHDKSHTEKEGILSFRDQNVLLLAVGDGVTPRTAGLFAFRTKWRCVSIDPMMRSGPWDDVTNLRTHRAKVQDVSVAVSSDRGRYERVVVVMWHCHASIAEAVSCLEFDGVKWDTGDVKMSRELRKRVAVVSCACCNYDAVQRVLPDGSGPDEEYEDTAVPGLMRTVRVWKFLE